MWPRLHGLAAAAACSSGSAFGIFALIVATAFGQVLLNRWNGPFYDALERRDMPELLIEPARRLWRHRLFADPAQRRPAVAQSGSLRMRMREGLVRDLADVWLKPSRALRSSPGGRRDRQQSRPAAARGHAQHPGGKHHGDWRSGSSTPHILLGELHRRPLGDLVGFRLPFRRPHHFGIPGYMVWTTILYALLGSVLSRTWGSATFSPRERLNAERYAREADLRFSPGARQREPRSRSRWRGGEAITSSAPCAFREVERGLGACCASSPGALANLTWGIGGRVRLAGAGGADHHRLADVFFGRAFLRRADDGGRAPSTRSIRRSAGMSSISASSPTGARRCCAWRRSGWR